MAIGPGIISTLLRSPWAGLGFPNPLYLIAGIVAVIAGVLGLVFRKSGNAFLTGASMFGLVLGAIGIGLALTTPVPRAALSNSGPGSNGGAIGTPSPASTGPDTASRLYPSSLLTPPPNAIPTTADTSPIATSARAVVNYHAVGIADAMIVPHHAGEAWPTTVSVSSSGAVTTNTGTRLGTLPAGEGLTYETLTDTDGTPDFVLTVRDGNDIGVVIDAELGTDSPV